MKSCISPDVLMFGANVRNVFIIFMPAPWPGVISLISLHFEYGRQCGLDRETPGEPEQEQQDCRHGFGCCAWGANGICILQIPLRGVVRVVFVWIFHSWSIDIFPGHCFTKRTFKLGVFFTFFLFSAFV